MTSSTASSTTYAKEVPHWSWDVIWRCQTDRQRRICFLIQQEQFRWGDERHGRPVKLSQDFIAQKTGIASRTNVNATVNELRSLGVLRTVRGSYSMTYELVRPDVSAADTSDGADVSAVKTSEATVERHDGSPDVSAVETPDVSVADTPDVSAVETHVERKSSTEALNGSSKTDAASSERGRAVTPTEKQIVDYIESTTLEDFATMDDDEDDNIVHLPAPVPWSNAAHVGDHVRHRLVKSETGIILRVWEDDRGNRRVMRALVKWDAEGDESPADLADLELLREEVTA